MSLHNVVYIFPYYQYPEHIYQIGFMNSINCMGSFPLIGDGKKWYLYKIISKHKYIFTILVSWTINTLAGKIGNLLTIHWKYLYKTLVHQKISFLISPNLEYAFQILLQLWGSIDSPFIFISTQIGMSFVLTNIKVET